MIHPTMASNKPDASCMLATIEDLKASRREIQSQHSTLGLHIATLDARISTLESQLREYAGRDGKVMSGVKSKIAQVDKATLADGVAHINLKVTGMDGQVVFFRMKRETPMEKLMNAWCDRLHLSRDEAGFLLQGRRFRANQTPEQLEMQDGDEIYVRLRLTGGSCGVMCRGVRI